MKQQHHPVDVKTFEKGINSDANKEMLATRQGEHVDALNMRSVSMDGDNYAKKKIKGEEILYPNIDNRCTVGTGNPLDSGYECMMTQEINGRIVEAWATLPIGNPHPSLIRIDGKIVLMSDSFPIRADYPLQYDKNETCIGGEFYMTDNLSRPMVFNMKDLLLNSGISFGSESGSCTQKYFDSFNIDQYVVGISSSLFKMSFIEQVNQSNSYDFVFGSQGLLIGMNSYSYRYATEDGDRSGWSPVTETIPTTRAKGVISKVNSINNTMVSGSESHHYKAGRYGGIANISSPTTYGNHLRLKYDNTNEFDFIEVRRDSWHSGSTLNTPPISEILGAFPIVSGLNVVDIFDYASGDETEEVLTEADIQDVPESVQRAKSLRYYNSKLWLMNVGYREKDVEIDFIGGQSDLIEPTIQKIYKEGHANVYNGTYYKSNMRGEANGFGVVLYDNSGSVSYAKSIVDNYQFPNRRDPVSLGTLDHSYFGVVKAADTNGLAPNNTHEIFDHVDSVDRLVLPGEFPPERGDLPYSVSNIGGQFPLLSNILREQSLFSQTSPYQTLNPVSQSDPQSDYNRRINTHIYLDNGYNADPHEYNPKAFGIDYYSMGAAFKGVDVSSIPEWADGFSVVQTNPAKRVIAQGLGYYSLIDTKNGISENGGKQSRELVCNFPDLDQFNGISPQIASDLIGTHGSSSPYRLEVVSSLGFFSEFHSYYSKDLSGVRLAIDAITYCRILKDSGEINPVWEGSSSLNDYVGFGTWRDTSENMSMFPFNTNNNLFTIDTIQEAPTQNLTAVNLKISTLESIYTQEYVGSNADNQEFDDPGLKKWHEPIYVVNIVRDDAQINSGLLTEYNYTGHYIKLKSKVLESDGSNTQSVDLVSERWEDCTQQILGQVNNSYSSLERFVWVEDALGIERRWLDTTYKTPAQVGVILNDISVNGFYTVTDTSGSYDVYGVYNVTQNYSGTGLVFTLTFENLPSENIVYVKYDNRIPVRVFGGDTWINEHVFPVLDFTYNSKGKPQDNAHEFKFNIPFPYPMYAMNSYIGLVGDVTNSVLGSRYLTDTKTNGGNVFYGGNVLAGLIYFDSTLFGVGGNGYRPSRWRQLVAMWAAETRINLSYSANFETVKSQEDGQVFPLKNYIPRPTVWEDGSDPDSLPPGGSFLDDNHIYDDYYNDYGREHDNWGRGGFRFRPLTNVDYSKKQITEIITSTPLLGFEEEVDFCTRVLWSVTRPINVQDSPTVKTFPPANFYDISDNTGEIKFAWDADSGKGNNLYAITDSGVCLLLVDKRIISEVNSNELATAGSDSLGGISDELWLNKQIGMDNETWRSWAEYSNTLFWNNSTSSYVMSGNEVKDLAETGYSELLRTAWIPKANKGVISKMSGVYDILHKEYWSTVDNRGQSGDNHSTLIFGTTQDALQCQSDYRYDKYLSIENKVYGMKGLETYELGVGNLIDDEEYECYVSGVSDADMYSDKEFIRIRVNSNSKPKRIEFFDDYTQYKSGVPSSIVDANANPISIKDYHGYECYIPRKTFAPNNRQQGRKVIFKIVSDTDENFFISTTGVQYKTLK